MIKSETFDKLRQNFQNFVYPQPPENATKIVKAEFDEQIAPNLIDTGVKPFISNIPTVAVDPSDGGEIIGAVARVQILVSDGNDLSLEDLNTSKKMSSGDTKSTESDFSGYSTSISCLKTAD
jgi:hypothetical protein